MATQRHKSVCTKFHLSQPAMKIPKKSKISSFDFYVPVCAHTFLGYDMISTNVLDPKDFANRFKDPSRKFRPHFFKVSVWDPKLAWKPLKLLFLQKFLHRNCVPVRLNTCFGVLYDQYPCFRSKRVCESLRDFIMQV